MTSAPTHLRVGDLPRIRREAANYTEFTNGLATFLERTDFITDYLLLQLAQAFAGIIDLQDTLDSDLKTVEPLSEDERTELEATYKEYRKMRGAVVNCTKAFHTLKVRLRNPKLAVKADPTQG